MDAQQACLTRCCPPCGGGCCPPGVFSGRGITVPADEAAAEVTIEGSCLSGVTGAEVWDPANPPASLPTVVTVGEPVIGVAPALDSVTVTLDTQGLGAGTFTLVLTNDCGCCAAINGSVRGGPPPPP